MALIERILLATDFSACAARAQDYARFIAQAASARLEILHVLEFQPGMDPEYHVKSLYLEELRKEAARHLERFAGEARALGLTVAQREVLGIPSMRINEAAQETNADLVVLGTHGRTGLEHILLGSTAERVVRGAPCPILTVRVPYEPGRKSAAVEGGGLPVTVRSVMVPVDFSDCSLEAWEYAVQVAKLFKATLTLLHVLEPVSYGLDFTLSHAQDERRMRERLDTRLADMVGLLEKEGLAGERILRGGLPADAILETAGREGCDLIVMGTHGRRGVSHFVSGSVAETVLRRAGCPVLSVKSPKFAPGHHRSGSGGASAQASGREGGAK
jgi:nucleotide-binding universal stress UspA family protein